jgi:hypothetical protein
MGNLYYSNVGAAVEVYTTASSGALASNMQNSSSTKYYDDISLLNLK